MKERILTLEVVKNFIQAENNYPVDFEDAWGWCGYSTKANAVRKLKSNFLENIDYIVFINSDEKSNSKPLSYYKLTSDCFKHFGMIAQTEKGKEVREYFIKCEKELKNLKKQSTFEIPKSLGDALLLAGNLAKDKEKLEHQLLETKNQVTSLTPLAEFAKSQFNMIQKVPLSSFGKYLSAKIPSMGKNSISSFLVDQKLLFRNRRGDIEIIAKYLRIDSNCQYFDLKPSPYMKPIIQNKIKIGEERATSWTKLILRSGMEKVIELCYQAGLINSQQFYLIQNDLPEWVKNAECEVSPDMAY